MTPEQNALVERLRELLTGEAVLREVSMFGGRAFMVNEKMVVSAGKDGSLLVRVSTDQHEQLLGGPGATQAEMGTGRDMGPGWIDVNAVAIQDDKTLIYWLDVAMEYNRVLTRK